MEPFQKIKSGDQKAIIVGCYGGEHVGDAAVLGGVLKRLKSAHGIQHFSVASSRPDRTRRWIDAIEQTDDIQVVPYDASLTPGSEGKNVLVFGGGPIMDIPSLLARHHATARKWHRAGAPIIAEGIGLGPFRRKTSELMAKSILSYVQCGTVRTNSDLKLIKKWGLDFSLSNDPAFDYLESIVTKKGNIIPKSDFDHYLSNSKPNIGLNLRPLWDRYYSRRVDQKKLNDFVLSQVVKLIDMLSDKYRFLFIPMNADQYGFSDLNIAYQLQDMLSTKDDYAIWWFEPNVAEAFHAFAKCQLAITMRFHATIFSLSANTPTIGIDYSIGEEGKVGALMRDRGLEDCLVSITNLNATELSDKISNLMN